MQHSSDTGDLSPKIIHDANNALSVLLMHCQLMRARLDAGQLDAAFLAASAQTMEDHVEQLRRLLQELSHHTGRAS